MLHNINYVVFTLKTLINWKTRDKRRGSKEAVLSDCFAHILLNNRNFGKNRQFIHKKDIGYVEFKRNKWYYCTNTT